MRESCVTDELGGSFVSYGIQRGETVIDDISLNRAEVEAFVRLLNRCNASEIHAAELVEDFLGK